MERETFGKILANRLSRMVLACAGLMLFAFGGYLQLQANIGLASWSSLNQGLALRFPISYGTASILVSVAVIAVDLLMKEPIGLGTILDAFLVGWGTDLFLRMGFPMLEDAMALQLLLLFLGMVIGSISICGQGYPAAPGMPLWWDWGSDFQSCPSAL